MVSFYFAPHQDDELTNLGPDLCRTLSRGGEAYVVLCTDGGASGVKRMLCNGGGCPWHKGTHTFTLPYETFVKARDTEFSASCRALGVPDEHVLISPLRAPDSALTVLTAKRIILHALSGFKPAECRVVTMAPMPEKGQNPDHTALGQAARELFAEGTFGDLRLTCEFILLPESGVPENASVITPTPEETEKIKNAAACYRLWLPGEGRYAVGYHSVADEFNDFLASPRCVIR